MSKIKETLDFLKKRNIKLLALKDNIQITINELKKKDFSFSESKRFTLIYVGAVFFIFSLFGGSSKNYIEVEALTCTNQTGKMVYKVTKDEIQAIAVYTKFTGLNKNLVNKSNKAKVTYKLSTNDKTGFTYSAYNPVFKKNVEVRYDYKKNQLFSDGKKTYDCQRKSSFAEAPKKLKTKVKMKDIDDPFKHASKFRWTSAGMACDLNGGVYNEYSKKYGELFTSQGKPQPGTARRVVKIEKISDKKFKIRLEFYNNTAVFRAYGDKYPVSISEKTYTLVAPDKMETTLKMKTADFNNLNVVSYTSKTENSTTEICD